MKNSIIYFLCGTILSSLITLSVIITLNNVTDNRLIGNIGIKSNDATNYSQPANTNKITKTAGEKEYISKRGTNNASYDIQTIPIADAVAILSREQDAKRAIIKKTLPAVVNIDTTKIVKVANRMNPFDLFFGFDELDQDPRKKQDGQGDGEKDYREYENNAVGSGFIIKNEGDTYYALTNYHVAGDVDKMTVTLENEAQYDAKYVGGDEKRDIAIISFKSKDKLDVLTLGDSKDVLTGDTVFVMGSPLGLEFTVTSGIISASNRKVQDKNILGYYIQTDAPINKGNSGGPLLNIKGEVIGMNTFIVSSSGDSAGLGFAIPINSIKDVLDQIIKNGQVEYGWLGVQTGPSKQVLTQLGYTKDQNGAFVINVIKDSPAMKQGLKPGDIVVRIGDYDIRDDSELVLIVRDLIAGNTYDFVVLRDKKEVTIPVKIEKRTKDSENKDSLPGFYVFPIDKEGVLELKRSKNLDYKEGDLLISVQKGSLANISGLQNLDKILMINDKTIKTPIDFYKTVSEDIDKKEMKITVLRQGREVSIIMKIKD